MPGVVPTGTIVALATLADPAITLTQDTHAPPQETMGVPQITTVTKLSTVLHSTIRSTPTPSTQLIIPCTQLLEQLLEHTTPTPRQTAV